MPFSYEPIPQKPKDAPESAMSAKSAKSAKSSQKGESERNSPKNNEGRESHFPFAMQQRTALNLSNDNIKINEDETIMKK